MDEDEDRRREQREARRRARMDRGGEDEDGSSRREEGGEDDDSKKQAEEERRQQEEERRQQEEQKRREEAAQERQKKQEEKAQREQQQQKEDAKKKRKPGQKRKGLGGLSKEKKKLLKQLIMQKAAEEMKAEMRRRQEEKENHLKKVVGLLEMDGLGQGQLESRVKELYERIRQLEGDKYDWELKIRRQEYEINELTIKVNDVKGKFVKPVLKKVSKTESKLARFEKKEDTQSLSAFRNQLKSTGQNKFALAEEKDDHTKTDWREHLKATKDGEHREEGDAVEAEAHVEI